MLIITCPSSNSFRLVNTRAVLWVATHTWCCVVSNEPIDWTTFTFYFYFFYGNRSVFASIFFWWENKWSMFQSVLDSLQIFPIIYEMHLHKISTYVIYTILFLRLYLYYLRKTCYTDWRLLIPFPPTPSLAKYHTLYPAQRVSNLSPYDLGHEL